jgi:hypothetical protein
MEISTFRKTETAARPLLNTLSLTQAIFGEAMCRDLVHKGFAATAGIPMAMLRMAANPLWAIDRCRASQKSVA